MPFNTEDDGCDDTPSSDAKYIAHFRSKIDGVKGAGILGVFDTYENAIENVYNYFKNTLKLGTPCVERVDINNGISTHMMSYSSDDNRKIYRVTVEYLPTNCIVDISI